MNFIDSVHQLPYSILVGAACPTEPLHGAPIPAANVIKIRLKDPEDELGADRSQGIMPESHFALRLQVRLGSESLQPLIVLLRHLQTSRLV
jgi:hypothetical protein